MIWGAYAMKISRPHSLENNLVEVSVRVTLAQPEQSYAAWKLGIALLTLSDHSLRNTGLVWSLAILWSLLFSIPKNPRFDMISPGSGNS